MKMWNKDEKKTMRTRRVSLVFFLNRLVCGGQAAGVRGQRDTTKTRAAARPTCRPPRRTQSFPLPLSRCLFVCDANSEIEPFFCVREKTKIKTKKKKRTEQTRRTTTSRLRRGPALLSLFLGRRPSPFSPFLCVASPDSPPERRARRRCVVVKAGSRRDNRMAAPCCFVPAPPELPHSPRFPHPHTLVNSHTGRHRQRRRRRAAQRR